MSNVAVIKESVKALPTESESLTQIYNRLLFKTLKKYYKGNERCGLKIIEIGCKCMNIGKEFILDMFLDEDGITKLSELNGGSLDVEVNKIKDKFMIENADLINTLPAVHRTRKRENLIKAIVCEIKAGMQLALIEILILKERC